MSHPTSCQHADGLALFDRFMFDLDAWAELADLYVASGMYQQAAFCQEELITGAPHNYLHHLQYAEVPSPALPDRPTFPKKATDRYVLWRFTKSRAMRTLWWRCS
jgi:hypothetical protein